MADNENLLLDDTNEQVEVRRQKLAKLRAAGVVAYPNDFKPSHSSADAARLAVDVSDEDLHSAPREVSVAGRIMALRRMGKASFFHLQDRSGKLQIYARKDRLGEDAYALFQTLDMGDIVGVRGPLFRTKTKELTVQARELSLLAKCLRTLTEKWDRVDDVVVAMRW